MIYLSVYQPTYNIVATQDMVTEKWFICLMQIYDFIGIKSDNYLDLE